MGKGHKYHTFGVQSLGGFLFILDVPAVFIFLETAFVHMLYYLYN
jgi:hypothetical protein